MAVLILSCLTVMQAVSASSLEMITQINALPGDFVGLGIGEDRTSIIWRSPSDPNLEVVISQPGYPYAPNSGQEFSAQDFYQNGRSAVAKLMMEI